ncbi:MAG: bifunctional nicotinamidase/pyrazinamidase [Spirochaetes bacterium]|nr:bifunctional nicotinamidase/pyrazinamidase [Spirochaetota bacterium]
MTIDRRTDAFIVIDIQRDFCRGGALAVPGGDDVVPLINRLFPRFTLSIFTQDWHTAGHVSFASAHPGKNNYETIALTYGEQTLWPDHCVQGTDGADFHPLLDQMNAAAIIRKGYHAAVDSYSAFFENDRSTPTGLAGFLSTLGVQRVFIAGLATDFCVLYSALDARALGLDVVVIDDASRGIDINGSLAAAHEAMIRAGIILVTADTL